MPKRVADEELTRETAEREEDAIDEDESVLPQGKASAEELAQRRIVKVDREKFQQAAAKAKTNTFANLSLKADKAAEPPEVNDSSAASRTAEPVVVEPVVASGGAEAEALPKVDVAHSAAAAPPTSDSLVTQAVEDPTIRAATTESAATNKGNRTATASTTTATPSITSSLFGGFGTSKTNAFQAAFGSSSGFGSGSSSSSSSLGGSSNRSSSLFGAAPGSLTAFTSFAGAAGGPKWGASTATKDEDEGDDDAESADGSLMCPSSPPGAKEEIPGLLDPSDIRTGEEHEQILLQVRAKLFKLEAKPVVAAAAADAVSTPLPEWVEVGIGPVRVLVADVQHSTGKNAEHSESSGSTAKDDAKSVSARMVMRRESHPGGPGTKVIMNVALRGKVSIEKQGDKALRMTAVLDKSVLSTFLLKVKTPEEADSLMKCTSRQLAQSTGA